MSPSQQHPSRRNPDVDARRRHALDRLGSEPFRAADALRVGLSASDLRSDAVHRLRRGVYVDARRDIDLPTRCAGLLLGQGPDVRVGAFTAAALCGFPVPHRDQVYLAYPKQPRRIPPGVVTVAPDLCRPTQRRRFGDLTLPVSHPVSMVAECARDIGLVGGVVLADAVLNTFAGTADDVRAAWAGNRRVSGLAEILALTRLGSESPMETRTRLLLVLGGFPEPAVQYEVVLAGRRRRFDLAYPEQRVAIEYDGGYHYASEGQKHADIMRAQEAEAVGWAVIHVVSYGIYRDPASTLTQVRRVLGERGMPCHLQPGWQQYFPGARRL